MAEDAADRYVRVERPSINLAGVLLVILMLIHILSLVFVLYMYSEVRTLAYRTESLTNSIRVLDKSIGELNEKMLKYEKIDVLIQTMIENLVRRLLNMTI